MIIGNAVHYAPLPLYQQVLVVLLAPPVLVSIFFLRIKGLGKTFGTSNTKMIQNATDWVAFITFLSLSYALGISTLIYAHFVRQ